MIRTIKVFTTIYVLAMIAALSAFVGLELPQGLIVTAILCSPLAVVTTSALRLRHIESRRLLAAFCVGFSIFSVISFYLTVTGSHDALWQVELYRIPLFGLPAAILTSVIALISDRLVAADRR